MKFYCQKQPDGTIHVQNAVMGHLGQHHVHTAAEFAAWRKGVGAKYLKLADAKACGCGLEPGQVREYDGKVWSGEKSRNRDADNGGGWGIY